MTAANRQPGRQEIEELLPWYATGTLSGPDAERVEQALAGDPVLVRRYEVIRRELAETTCLNEALGAPSPRAMQKLFAAINAALPSSSHRANELTDVHARQRSRETQPY